MGSLGCCDAVDMDIVRSFRVTQAPLAIRPTESFTIAIEAKERRRYPDEHICYDCDVQNMEEWKKAKQRREERARRNGVEHGEFLSAKISSGDIFASIKGDKDLLSYLDEGGVERAIGLNDAWYYKGATSKSDTVKLKVEFTPKDKRVDHLGNQEFYYDAHAGGGRKVKLDIKTQYPFYKFNLPTDTRGYLLPEDITGGTGINGITIYVGGRMGGLKLHYEPVRPDDPALTSLRAFLSTHLRY